MPVPNKDATRRIIQSVKWTEAVDPFVSLPYTRKRPLIDSGSPGSTQAIVIIDDTVPAAVVTAAGITAGELVAVGQVMKSEDGITWTENTDVGAVTVANISMTAIHASSTVPVALQCTIVGSVGAGAVYLATTIMDFRTLPGYDEGLLQIPYHKAGEPNYQQDATDCQQAVAGAPTNP